MKNTSVVLVIFLLTCSCKQPDHRANSSHADTDTIAKLAPPDTDTMRRPISAEDTVEKNAFEAQNPENTINASELVSSYMKNEVKSDYLYKGKMLYIVAKVWFTDKDEDDNYFVTLKPIDPTVDYFRITPQCFVKDLASLAELKTGDKITVYGECIGEKDGKLQIINCKIVNPTNAKRETVSSDVSKTFDPSGYYYPTDTAFLLENSYRFERIDIAIGIKGYKDNVQLMMENIHGGPGKDIDVKNYTLKSDNIHLQTHDADVGEIEFDGTFSFKGSASESVSSNQIALIGQLNVAGVSRKMAFTYFAGD